MAHDADPSNRPVVNMSLLRDGAAAVRLDCARCIHDQSIRISVLALFKSLLGGSLLCLRQGVAARQVIRKQKDILTRLR